MGLVKKITIFSLLIAALAGTLVKVLQQRQNVKKTVKNSILSVLFRLIGRFFNFMGNKIRCNQHRSWKTVFKMG
jgi:hypothetical protein